MDVYGIKRNYTVIYMVYSYNYNVFVLLYIIVIKNYDRLITLNN